jgi:rhodanese-related sulfurtransferase
MKLVPQIATMILGGSVLGLGLNVVSPEPIKLGEPVFAPAESGAATCSAPHDQAHAGPSAFPFISPEVAAGMCDGCRAAFVDARAATEFAEGHIPKAFHLPPHGHGNEAAVITELRTYPTVVVYDSGLACNLADTVAAHLREEGLSDVRILAGAWPAWEKSGGPAESGSCQACSGAGALP